MSAASDGSPIDVERVLALRDVSLRFGSTAALDSISLDVVAGERVALVGPSGAGKSSLISVANASIAPTSGTVEVLGRRPVELSAGDRRELRSRIGTVYQALHLPGPLRVVHNVAAGQLGRWSTARALRSLIRPVGIDEIQAALDSLGIGDKLWNRTDELSGGERQRVAIARLLVQQPEIVLADEPVASLDPARAREVIELLLAAAAGQRSDAPVPSVAPRSLIVSLHAFDLAVEYFDRVIGLRNGRVLFDESAAVLRSDVDGERANALYDLVEQPTSAP